MRRTLTWVQNTNFRGWGCSECAWLFKPVGGPTGNSLEEMAQAFVLQRDQEFAAHSCVKHPKQRQDEKPLRP
jgi:hypothetical protein